MFPNETTNNWWNSQLLNVKTLENKIIKISEFSRLSLFFVWCAFLRSSRVSLNCFLKFSEAFWYEYELFLGKCLENGKIQQQKAQMFIFPCLRQGVDWNTFDVALERLRFASSVFPLFRTTKKAFEKANRPSLGGFAWIERSEYQSTPWIQSTPSGDIQMYTGRTMGTVSLGNRDHRQMFGKSKFSGSRKWLSKNQNSFWRQKIKKILRQKKNQKK